MKSVLSKPQNSLLILNGGRPHAVKLLYHIIIMPEVIVKIKESQGRYLVTISRDGEYVFVLPHTTKNTVRQILTDLCYYGLPENLRTEIEQVCDMPDEIGDLNYRYRGYSSIDYQQVLTDWSSCEHVMPDSFLNENEYHLLLDRWQIDGNGLRYELR